MKTLREIYAYREMIVGLVRRDLRGRYKGSVLGFLWTFINPLLQLLVYTFVFSVVMKNGIEKYPVWLFIALIPWLFFSTSITSGCSSVLASQDMVKKIYFPREVLPIATVTSGFVNMLYCFVVIFAVLLISRIGFNFLALLCLPIIMIVEYLLALGFALLFSALTVYFRDLQYILTVITMAWMYMTPVLYQVDILPENLTKLFYLNPMTPIIVAYRDILFYKQVPQLQTLLLSLGVGVFFCVVGFVVFHKLQKHFIEEL